MAKFEPRDHKFDARVRASFARQAFMGHIGARIIHLAPGAVDLEVAHAEALLQQHGFIHAGVTASIADSAAGYAAYSLFEQGAGVLTAEFKLNLLAPAKGQRLVAQGRVIRPGRTLNVCKSDVFAHDGGSSVLCATALLTMMRLPNLEA